VYLAWFFVWGRNGVNSEVSFDPRDVVNYVASGVWASVKVWTATSVRSGVVLVAGLAWLVTCWWRLRDPQQRAQQGLRLASALGVVAVFTTIAFGRVTLAPAGLTRYTYVASALLVVPVAAMLTELLAPVRRLPRGTMLVALVSALTVALPIRYGVQALRATSARSSVDEQNLRRFMVASVELFRHGEPVTVDKLRIAANPGVTVDLLRTLSRTNDLGAQSSTESERQRAAALLQVAVATYEPSAFATGHPRLRSIEGAVMRDGAGGCRDVSKPTAPSARLLLDIQGATTFTVMTSADVTVAVDPAGSSARITSDRVGPRATRPAQRLWVALTWNGRIELTITGGPATICGVES
jgi:hypothetical protein